MPSNLILNKIIKMYNNYKIRNIISNSNIINNNKFSSNIKPDFTLIKRDYLIDYKPFDIYDISENAYNLTLQLIKSTSLCSCLALLEYNIYLDKCMFRENEIDRIKEFYDCGSISNIDAESMIKKLQPIEEVTVDTIINKYKPKFIELFSRFYISSLIKKLYEHLSVTYLSKRIADKLTKDIKKSFTRKLTAYSSYEASRRIFQTCMLSNLYLYMSTVTYDVFYATIKFVYKKDYKKLNLSILVKNLIWFTKTIGVSGASLFGSSLGYAVGGYCFGLTFGSPALAMLFEIVSSAFVQSLFGLESNDMLIPRLDKKVE